MTGRVFVDTSGFLAALNPGDPRHEQASDLLATATGLVTHSLVLAEAVASSTTRLKHVRPRVLSEVVRLLDEPEILVEEVDEDLLRESLVLLRDRYRDKLWSLCDMVSFVLMDRLHIREALTHDDDFQQAGFVCLLRDQM